jgi:hypothetical protein
MNFTNIFDVMSHQFVLNLLFKILTKLVRKYHLKYDKQCMLMKQKYTFNIILCFPAKLNIRKWALFCWQFIQTASFGHLFEFKKLCGKIDSRGEFHQPNPLVQDRCTELSTTFIFYK